MKVKVNFTGVVSVDTPHNLSERDATLLAQKLVLARLLATCDPVSNPNAPEEDAFYEYTDSCSEVGELTAEQDWDSIKHAEVCGEWTVKEN